jgi:lipopolysaccharide export system permease protein
MRLLDRYLLRELLLPLAYCLVGFSISFIAFDLFDKLSDLQRAKLSGGEIVEYYLDRLPEFLITSYVMPLSLLLAMLYALTNHSRHNEITAMRAAAIPLWRIAMPYFVTGAIFSLAAFYLNEQLLPEGIDAAEQLKMRHVGDQSRSGDKIWRKSFFFVNTAANRSWRIGAYHLQHGIMVKPYFDWRRPDGTRLQLHADEARWIDGQWVFSNNVEQLLYGREVGALPHVSRTNVLVIPDITETPRVIRSEVKISALSENFRSLRRVQLSSREILDYLELHPKLPRKQANPLRTLLHSRLAAPWICLVIVFIAVPFGAIPGRRNVFVGVASSVFICFLFLMMKDLTLAFGSRGWITPALAAWLPNLLFIATGIVLMWRVR